jgi:hypothetical protein
MSDGRAAWKRRWTWIGLAAPALALLAAAAWYWRMHDAGGDAAAVRARSALALKVDRAGADYRVTWDGASPAVLAASAGTLSVEDGSFRKDLALDREQLRTATLMYSPATDDVTFTLKVFGSKGNAVMESRRLLLDKLPEPAP